MMKKIFGENNSYLFGILISAIILGIQITFVTAISSCSNSSQKPPTLSKNVCKELCTKSNNSTCLPSGACICEREPTPTSLGGGFVHCTNWNYVPQKECKTLCQPTGKNDTRVCWTVAYGHFCTCF